MWQAFFFLATYKPDIGVLVVRLLSVPSFREFSAGTAWWTKSHLVWLSLPYWFFTTATSNASLMACVLCLLPQMAVIFFPLFSGVTSGFPLCGVFYEVKKIRSSVCLLSGKFMCLVKGKRLLWYDLYLAKVRCICTHVLNTYMDTWLATQTNTRSTHTNTKRTNGLILLLSLADQDEGLSVEYQSVHMYRVDPSSSWAQSAQ